MFNMLKINDIETDGIGLENMNVQSQYFFTIKHKNYINIYNKEDIIIGRVPYDYAMLFKFPSERFFEDIGMEELKNFTNNNIEVDILCYDVKKHKPIIKSNNEIGKFELVEDIIVIPFTNYAVESEGIFVFKNINSLASALLDDIKRIEALDVEEV